MKSASADWSWSSKWNYYFFSILFWISEFVFEVVDSVCIFGQDFPWKLFVHRLDWRESSINEMNELGPYEVKRPYEERNEGERYIEKLITDDIDLLSKKISDLFFAFGH